MAYCNSGIAREAIKQNTEAAAYFRQALACAIHTNNLQGQNFACEHIVIANMNLKDYKVARMYLLKRLKLVQEMEDISSEVLVHQQLGEMLRVWRGGEDKESKEHFEAALRLLNDRETVRRCV